MTDDQAYLEQVRKLTATARMATEEAEMYTDQIEDPKLKEEAQRLLDLHT